MPKETEYDTESYDSRDDSDSRYNQTKGKGDYTSSEDDYDDSSRYTTTQGRETRGGGKKHASNKSIPQREIESVSDSDSRERETTSYRDSRYTKGKDTQTRGRARDRETDRSYSEESNSSYTESRYTRDSRYTVESKKPVANDPKKRPNLTLLLSSKQSSVGTNSVRNRFLVGKISSVSKDGAIKGPVSIVSGSKDGKKSTGFSASKRFQSSNSQLRSAPLVVPAFRKGIYDKKTLQPNL